MEVSPSELLEERIISWSCENSEERYKGPRLCDHGGQMFFPPMHLASELRSLQLITPLTIFCFSGVEEKMPCLIPLRGHSFDAGTVKFVIC